MNALNLKVRPIAMTALAAILGAILISAPTSLGAEGAEAASEVPAVAPSVPGAAPSMLLGLASLDTGTLEADEAAGLLYMVEEEKLAHDLYLELHSLWNLPAFQRIAESEAAHMAAVSRLLVDFGLDDPTRSYPSGVFAEPQLQALYDSLLAQASESPEAALRAAIAVEETDIRDLETRLAQTDEASIQRVYANLLRGSQHHLRAFSTLIARTPSGASSPQPSMGTPPDWSGRAAGMGRHGRSLPWTRD